MTALQYFEYYLVTTIYLGSPGVTNNQVVSIMLTTFFIINTTMFGQTV